MVYHVWKRMPDGYIAASNTQQSFADFCGRPGSRGTWGGIPTWFEHLLTTDDWDVALEAIIRGRSARCTAEGCSHPNRADDWGHIQAARDKLEQG